MSLSFAIFKVPSININPYLSRNKQCAARRGHLRQIHHLFARFLALKMLFINKLNWDVVHHVVVMELFLIGSIVILPTALNTLP
jgi:hypothetical protein